LINTDMRSYNYFTFGADSDYGIPQLSAFPIGQIKIAINIASQAVQDNILYKDCTYIGLTKNANVDDTYVIEYEGKRLKVLYVNPKGRYKVVFLGEM